MGTIMGMGFFWLQKNVVKLVDYESLPLYTGLLMGSGALIGDSIKSFFKRQLGIKPGNNWFPWDQIDWILGFMVFTYPIYRIPLLDAAKLILLALGLHLLIKKVGYWLKLE